MSKPASRQVERAIGLLADAIAADVWERLIDNTPGNRLATAPGDDVQERVRQVAARIVRVQSGQGDEEPQGG